MEIPLPIAIIILMIVLIGTSKERMTKFFEGLMELSDNLFEIIIVTFFIIITTSYLMIYSPGSDKRSGTFRGTEYDNKYVATIN